MLNVQEETTICKIQAASWAAEGLADIEYIYHHTNSLIQHLEDGGNNVHSREKI